MRSKRSLEGELVIDHRNSPGISEEFAARARANGVPVIAVPGGSLYESATVICAHCGNEVVLNPKRTRPRGYCGTCDHYVCDSPLCNRDCTPMARALDSIHDHLEHTGALPAPSILHRLMPSVFGPGEKDK